MKEPCKDITLHRRGMCACGTGFLLFIAQKKTPPCPPELAVPTGACPSSRALLPLWLCPLLPSQPVCCPCCRFCDHPRYLLLSFPGPWKQRDSLPEGWHLERLLSSLQGNAGPVRPAHAAQQPPEAAVLRRLRHRSVSISSEGDEEEDGIEWEEGRSLQSFKSPSPMDLFA